MTTRVLGIDLHDAGRDGVYRVAPDDPVTLVSDAQRSRAPIQRLADVVSSWFVPGVVASAVLAAAVWGLVGPEPRAVYALVNAVAVLIIACPCAMGLATPTSIMVGTCKGAELGLLFRKGEALETLQGAGEIALDKTGTLTVGKPVLTDCRPLGALPPPMRNLLPPPLAGEGWGGGRFLRGGAMATPSLSLPRKRGRGRCGDAATKPPNHPLAEAKQKAIPSRRVSDDLGAIERRAQYRGMGHLAAQPTADA